VENQIGHAIKLIAENHCELNEKLNKIMKDQAYFNKIDVRLDVLESDVELLKKQVGA
jgi:hypothetical protein